MGGGGSGRAGNEVQKKIFAQGKIKWKKNRARQLFLKKYSCYDLKKKIHARNLIAKKNSCCSKIPLPPLSSGTADSRDYSMYSYCDQAKLELALVLLFLKWELETCKKE